jgi:hypothetical protein
MAFSRLSSAATWSSGWTQPPPRSSLREGRDSRRKGRLALS